MLTIALVIGLGNNSSGAAGDPSPPVSRTLSFPETAARVSAPVETSGANRSARPRACPSVRKALAFYTKRWRHWTQLRGAGSSRAEGKSRRHAACPRYLLKIRVRKAAQAHREWNRHFRYHYAWSEWLPDKWQRIGACETGYGRRPGQWTWNSGTYQGAFGFYHGSWDAFVPRADPKAGPYPSEAYLATPRQQYEVALAIYRAYGFSGWGCRGA